MISPYPCHKFTAKYAYGEASMEAVRMRRLEQRKAALAGVALVALIAGWGGITAGTAAAEERGIEDRIPVPEPPNVPPPSLAEVKQPAVTGDVDALVPMPEFIDVPQITRDDVIANPAIVENPVADKLRDLLAARTDRVALLCEVYAAGVASLVQRKGEPPSIVERVHERVGHRSRLSAIGLLVARVVDPLPKECDELMP